MNTIKVTTLGEQSKELMSPGVFTFPLKEPTVWKLAGATVPMGTWGLE